MFVRTDGRTDPVTETTILLQDQVEGRIYCISENDQKGSYEMR